MSTARPRTRPPYLSALEEDFLTLLRGREMYGLEIIKEVALATAGTRRLGVGSAYPTLAKMEHKGLVVSRWGDDRGDARTHARRRYYSVTDHGGQVLEETQQRREALARVGQHGPPRTAQKRGQAWHT